MYKRKRSNSFVSSAAAPRRVVYGPAKRKGPARAFVRNKRSVPQGVTIFSKPYWDFGPSQAQTFPARMVTKMIFNQIGALTCTNTAMAVKEFRLNSPYDPDVDLGGNSAYYFDTLCGGNGTLSPYRKYRVLSSKAEVEFVNQDNASAGVYVGGTVGIDVDGVDSDADGANLLMQRPGTKLVPLGTSGSGNSQRALIFYNSHKDLLGVKDMKDADDQIGAYNGNPPGSEIDLDLWVFPVDWSDTTARTVYYRARISYTVEFFELNTVVES